MRQLILLPVWLVSFTLTAQDVPEVVFGKVSDEDRRLTEVPGDPTAEAYVLYDRQSLDFGYSDAEGPSLIETFHQRIKLLRPSSFDRADVVLRYNRAYEQISNVEAYLHPAGGGTIAVRPEQIVDEVEEDDERVVKFTFPRVSEGTIIEYRYTRRGKNILIPTPFVFQQDIPVRWAQYDAMIPPYYGYVSLGTGALDVNEVKITKRAWGPRWTTGAYRTDQDKIEHSDILWAKRDLPAFRSQPYSNNASDYLPKIQLQLQSVQYPNRPKQTIFGDWQETVDELQARQDFGRYYRNKINYSKVWKAFEPDLAGLQSDREKVVAAYRFVTQSIGWTGRYYFLATDSPNKIFDNRAGNSADLNIVLLSLLNEAGIEAHPLLVSLRNTGAPIEQYPLLDQFNHLMVYTELDGNPFFLDAGDADRPPGLPRERALNHRGWIADKDNPRWVTIDVPSSRQVTMVEMNVGADGRATGKIQGRLENYFAFAGRSTLSEATTEREKPVVRDIMAAFPEATVDSFTVLEGKSDQAEQFNYEAQLTVPAAQVLDDYLYLQTVILPLLEGDLADADQRSFPIDFPYPWEHRYIASVHLPEGYHLEEAPAPVRLKAEDGSIVATFSSQETVPGLISVALTVQLGRTLYAAHEYDALRDMFRRIIEMQEAPLVLKRQTK
ncbi:DUF3857 domain-containing protein [Lewinella sp. IMCC34191]|uniref:DUF3857 domain-containing protein n=1 Tax=Lewinella sp. IMCC34191 TaxID=2259172 RepID=UPI000E233CDE|nr:DUF3857 domain-containing protein [Lewinella sp. IMCC34191]